MSGKDVWKWLLPKLKDEVLLEIYKSDKKIVLNGFRTNTVQDIAVNRKRVINNLLQPSMYLRLLNWAIRLPSDLKEEELLSKKEVNELMEIADDKGLPYVLLHLFYEKADKVAISVFSKAKDEHSELLDIPNQSVLKEEPYTIEKKKIGKQEQEKAEEKGASVEASVSKSENKKIIKLSKKVESLAEELSRKEKDRKRKLAEVTKKKDELAIELIEEKEKNKELESECAFLKSRMETYEKNWREERSSKQSCIGRLERELEVLKKKEEEYIQEIVALLEQKETTQEPLGIKESNQEVVEVDETEEREKSVLVIGEPVFQEDFKVNNHIFSFLPGEEAIEFDFSTNYYDEYWILVYTLSQREQYLLGNKNDSYIYIREKSDDKVKLFKNYTLVNTELNKIERELERV